jgi:lysophospholipase L1-like esterase
LKIYDQSGNARDLTFGAARPTVNTAGFRAMLDWGLTANNSIKATSSATIDLTALISFSVFDYSHLVQAYLSDFSAAGNQFAVLTSNAQISQYNDALMSYGAIMRRGVRQVTSIFQTGNDRMRNNGVELTSPGNAGDTARAGVVLNLGNFGPGGFGWTGRIGEHFLFTDQLTDDQISEIEKEQSTYFVTGSKRLVAHGDSLTFGEGLTTTEMIQKNYPAQTRDAIAANWELYSRGTSGATILDLTNEAATVIDTLYRSNAAENILLFQGGFNDAFSGATAAQIQDRIKTYCLARKVIGWRIIVHPIPLSNFAGQPANYAATRTTVNNWLAANWSTFADAYADFTGDPYIGDSGNTADVTYFQNDQVHLTIAGYTRWSIFSSMALDSLSRVVPPAERVRPLGAYGLRRLRSDYSGPVVRIHLTSDGTDHDIGFNAQGDFDRAAFNALGSGREVLMIYDQSGNARDLTFGAARPTVNIAGFRAMLDWGFTTSNSIKATSTALVSVGFPVACAVFDYAHFNIAYLVDFGASVGNQFATLTNNAQISQYNGALMNYGSVMLRGVRQVTSIFQTGNDRMRNNGAELTSPGNAGDTARANVPINLGNYALNGLGWTGRIGELWLFDDIISATDLSAIEANQMGYFVDGSKRLAAHGDSLTFGYNLTTLESVTKNYPAQTRDNLAANWELYSRGTSGLTITELINEAATVIDPLFQASAAKNILLFQGGYNDANNNADAATIQNRILTYCQARRAVGWLIVVHPLPLSNFASQPANYATTRAAVNTWLKNNWSTFADAYADLTVDPIIGDSGNTADATYFQGDQVHLTAAGYTRWAIYSTAAVQTIG